MSYISYLPYRHESCISLLIELSAGKWIRLFHKRSHSCFKYFISPLFYVLARYVFGENKSLRELWLQCTDSFLFYFHFAYIPILWYTVYCYWKLIISWYCSGLSENKITWFWWSQDSCRWVTTLHSQIKNMYGNTDGPNIVYLSPLSSPVGLVIEAQLRENGVCV